MAALARKCKKAHGFLEKYSFGVRYEVRYLIITPMCSFGCALRGVLPSYHPYVLGLRRRLNRT